MLQRFIRCDKVDNLWMNLTDGSINCGRKNFDGSGGNNHAVDHYAQTNYPLVLIFNYIENPNPVVKRTTFRGILSLSS